MPRVKLSTPTVSGKSSDELASCAVDNIREHAMNPEGSLIDHIRDLEEQMLRPGIRRSPAALGALIADHFVEFASDGRAYTKAQVIAALQHENRYSRSLVEFRLQLLQDRVALATYRSVRRDEASGENVESLRSSLWIQRDDKWQVVFHQGTHVGP
jgi:hypothetical protein